MYLLDINYVLFQVLGYPISLLELIATIFMLVSVFCATRANIITWPTGLVSNVAFFVLFYQVNLYSDMVLQVFFFGISIYGWWNWRRKSVRANQQSAVKIQWLDNWSRNFWFLGLAVFTVLWGFLMARIHIWLPVVFPQAAAFPFPDALTTVLSIGATVLMAQKKLEAWVLWIIVDVVATYLYWRKDLLFVSVEFFIFLLMSVYGLMNWMKEKDK